MLDDLGFATLPSVLFGNLTALISAHPEHFLLEIVLIISVVFLIFHKSQSKDESTVVLTPKEEESLLAEWAPAPLISNECTSELEKISVASALVVHSKPGRSIVVEKGNGSPPVELLNFATRDFLGFSCEEPVLEHCSATIEKYGTGSCGPRGFYGTIDVHLKLEDVMAKFLRREKAILYASAYATVTSTICVFAHRGDFLICDEKVNHAIKLGCRLSRANVYYFKHNDVADMERVFQNIDEQDKKLKRKLRRRFVVVEGVYQDDGSLASCLPEIVKLRKKYKFRIMVDESLSLGILGDTGRGITEHFSIPVREISLQVADLGNVFCSSTGICAGDTEAIDHCRLNGSGYIFSAAPPPYLSTAAIEAIRLLESSAERVQIVRENAQRLRVALSSASGLVVTGDCISPCIHLQLAKRNEDRTRDEVFLQSIVNKLIDDHQILITRNKFAEGCSPQPPPSLKLFVTFYHTQDDVEKLATAIQEVMKSLDANPLL